MTNKEMADKIDPHVCYTVEQVRRMLPERVANFVFDRRLGAKAIKMFGKTLCFGSDVRGALQNFRGPS